MGMQEGRERESERREEGGEERDRRNGREKRKRRKTGGKEEKEGERCALTMLVTGTCTRIPVQETMGCISELRPSLPRARPALCLCTYLRRAVSRPRTRRPRDSTAPTRTTRPPERRDENSN